MVTIELRPPSGSPAVEGSGKSGEVLYLMGREGALRWAPQPDAGALSLAVVFFQDDDAILAPVHPMCHVSDGSPRQLSLGTEKFAVHVIGKNHRRSRTVLVVAALFLATLIAGWCLHALVPSASPVTPISQEEMYMF